MPINAQQQHQNSLQAGWIGVTSSYGAQRDRHKVLRKLRNAPEAISHVLGFYDTLLHAMYTHFILCGDLFNILYLYANIEDTEFYKSLYAQHP